MPPGIAPLAAAGIAALAALGIGTLLQFSASRGLPMLLWPPPASAALGGSAANFMLAVMFAAQSEARCCGPVSAG